MAPWSGNNGGSERESGAGDGRIDADQGQSGIKLQWSRVSIRAVPTPEHSALPSIQIGGPGRKMQLPDYY
jgi:hypothetical protein